MSETSTCTAIVLPLKEGRARPCGRAADHLNDNGAPRCCRHRKGGKKPLPTEPPRDEQMEAGHA